MAERLIAMLDRERKQVKSGRLKDGSTASVGDEVHDEEGQVGVVRALYRGLTVIEYEDGTANDLPTDSLLLVPAEDVTEEAAPAPRKSLLLLPRKSLLLLPRKRLLLRRSRTGRR